MSIHTHDRCRRWLSLLMLTIVVSNTAGAAEGPAIRLFPTTVVEDIRETGAIAEAMESGLQDVVERLDLQQQLYTESLCEDAPEDTGCERIQKQLGETYLQLLTTMGEHLPAMERAVRGTRSSLERRLREELGQRTTPTDLQNLLLGETGRKTRAVRDAALPERTGIRLSDRFKRYHHLVSTASNRHGQSLAIVAADIYLDMDEATQLLAATQEEISRAALMEQLNQSFGSITPEMESVVAGVKSILFGAPGSELRIAAPPVGPADRDWSSPLAM